MLTDRKPTTVMAVGYQSAGERAVESVVTGVVRHEYTCYAYDVAYDEWVVACEAASVERVVEDFGFHKVFLLATIQESLRWCTGWSSPDD